MKRIGRYLQALATVVRRSAIPHDYTITIWTSGAVLEHGHGSLTLGQTYLFLLGAVGGFAAIALIAARSAPRSLEPAVGALLRIGAINGCLSPHGA
jgi:hypothetical protein